METILLLTALASSAIFLTIFISLIKEIKTSSFNSKEIPLIVLGIVYLVFTITLILWITSTLTFQSSDLLIVISTILIIQAICILAILYKIRKNRKIYLGLIPLAFLIPLVIHAPKFLHLTIPTSFFIILITFLTTTSINGKTTRCLILYTSISLFLYLFAILWQNLISTFALISTILFLIFTIPFLKFLQQTAHNHYFPPSAPESPLIHFLKHFVFIIIITNFIFIGTVSVHEFGHLLASSSSGCEETKIVYELQGLPHTEINCADLSNKNRWTLGGILLPITVAIFLFFAAGKFIKELSLQIIGFNLMISYLDFMALGISKTIATFISVSGVALTIFSLALLIKSRVE